MALNIADLFEHAADAVPDRVAVACGDRQVTYREMDERTNRLAHHLASLGVGKDDHVGLYARNSIEAVETLIATYKLRARTVNINYRYVEAELRYMVDDADLVALVYDRQFAPLVSVVLADSPGVRGTVAIDDGSADLGEGPGEIPGAGVPDVPYDAALAAQSPDRDFGPRSGDDIYLLYTGGTTGYPKGVLWRQEDVWRTLGGGIDFMTGAPLPDEWAQSRSTANGPGMVKLCGAPLIHGSAQWTTLMSFFTGDTVVLLPQFDPHEAWRAVQRHKVNVIVVVGDAMARPLIDAFAAGGYDGSSVLSLSSNGALFSQSVKDAAFAALPNVVITDAIGSSETGFTGLGFASSGGQTRGGPTVHPGPSTIVIDDAGHRVGPGEIGRIARGGHVPLGYYKDPVKTAAMFVEVDGERYVVPGDFARVEDDGTVTLLGRGNVCVNTGGEKVFPEEVEGAIKEHPDVFDTLVIGVPDERLGQRVAAIVQPRDGASLDLADLEAVVRKHVAGYKVPRTVWLTDHIGRTPSGKADYAWARRFADERLAVPVTGDGPPAARAGA
ncbi:MAG TPA: acyl-CoA synthetase [Streptosporangiaceae bacterium]|nr:acyl-CoA synthetase [Streptosporangiaceae bacterium]